MSAQNHSLFALTQKAKQATHELVEFKPLTKKKALFMIADEIEANMDDILSANDKDMLYGREQGLSDALLDRLLLTVARITDMVSEIRYIADLPELIGRESETQHLDNGLKLSRRCEPIGVIGVIYESRPNVVIDIATLCLKTSNACVFCGGKDTFHSSTMIIKVIHSALKKVNISIHAVQYIQNTENHTLENLLSLDEEIDMIIPRGSRALHQFCKENSHIPVMTGGFGVSHIYVDETADLERAVDLIINAKVHRPSACNALDTLLVNKKIARDLFIKLVPALNEHDIQVMAGSASQKHLKGVNQLKSACDEDYHTEWLSLILNVKQVNDVHHALEHMQKHNAKHSDAILTNDLSIAELFVNKAGSAAVYVNASTRFTDGKEFGLGAEVGVSTQKLHVRGPIDIEALTTYKWVGKGDYLSRN